MVLNQIHNTFIDYTASFDLEDCDKILRVECLTRPILANGLIRFLGELGYVAEVLPDDDPPAASRLSTFLFAEAGISPSA
ncbi:hypothetical protein [Fibrisoma limi]|nr:hypothetical protein [Fibrisoma limi]